MYNIPNIKRLHIELTSRCNASCPACNRNISGGPIAPNITPEDLYIEDIQKMFPAEILKNIELINYCGNLGDPGIARDLFEVVDFFKQNASPRLVQVIRSNAGMRTPEYWTKLGKLFQWTHKPDHIFSHNAVVFSVDGLADTNHIYRRGVVWDKVWENMRAYSLAGGYGVWEFLIFDHNKHQVDEARELANQLGFEFLVKNPMGFGDTDGVRQPMFVLDKNGEYEYSIWPHDFDGERIEPARKPRYDPNNPWAPSPLTDYSRQLVAESTIKCKSLVDIDYEEIYITASGHLLPCCYLGGALGKRPTSYGKLQFNEKINAVGLDNFDLKKHDMLEILNGPVFSKFFKDAWEADTIENGKMLFCVEVCGEKSQIDKIYAPEFHQSTRRKIISIEPI